jgi:hypothetical protein
MEGVCTEYGVRICMSGGGSCLAPGVPTTCTGTERGVCRVERGGERRKKRGRGTYRKCLYNSTYYAESVDGWGGVELVSTGEKKREKKKKRGGEKEGEKERERMNERER